MGEFFLELFAEIIGEAFLESSIDLSRSKYVPKWLRIIVITIAAGVFGGFLLLIIWAVIGKGVLLLVIGIIIAVIWLFMVIKALTIKTKRYEYVPLDDNNTFKGKRTYLGLVTGTLKPENISSRLGENREIKVSFSRTVEFPEKEQFAVIEEQEMQLLKELYFMQEETYNLLINRARNELVKKLGNKDNCYSNGKGIALKKVSYVKSPEEYMIFYYFRDEKTGKKVKVKDKRSLL
ncbi:MAG: DUF4386 domain-containing protein [Lachnospiraceae bacterium]